MGREVEAAPSGSMERYLVPLKNQQQPQTPKPTQRNLWKRSLIELSGKFEPKYRRGDSTLLMESYSEIGAFPHLYHIDGFPCQTHAIANGAHTYPSPIRKQGVSAIDFDNRGIYLASVTKSGCLTVHDFETLYCQSTESVPCLKEDETKQLLHLSLHRQIDAVRWNTSDQNEVACASVKSNEVLIFDVGLISSKPIEVLRTRNTYTVHGPQGHKGLSDIAFTSTDDSRVIASDTHGIINLWDRRSGCLPCLELTTNSRCALNSIRLSEENDIIFGADRHGIIYMWELRGGRSSTSFQNHKEACRAPLTSLKVASMLGKIESLKAQSDIVSKEVHSIDLDPSNPFQLAFHLDDGWSGVMDIREFQVTHIHCPPPAWLNESNTSADLLNLRQPSWLPTDSMYAVGSSYENGIHLLDFYPNTTSPSHVDYSCDGKRHKQNRFIPLSEGITACAAHPLNGTIIAGTQVGFILAGDLSKTLITHIPGLVSGSMSCAKPERGIASILSKVKSNSQPHQPA